MEAGRQPKRIRELSDHSRPNINFPVAVNQPIRGCSIGNLKKTEWNGVIKSKHGKVYRGMEIEKMEWNGKDKGAN